MIARILKKILLIILIIDTEITRVFSLYTFLFFTPLKNYTSNNLLLYVVPHGNYVFKNLKLNYAKLRR